MDALAEGQLRSSLLELDAHGSLAPRVEPTVPSDLLQSHGKNCGFLGGHLPSQAAAKKGLSSPTVPYNQSSPVACSVPSLCWALMVQRKSKSGHGPGATLRRGRGGPRQALVLSDGLGSGGKGMPGAVGPGRMITECGRKGQ